MHDEGGIDAQNLATAPGMEAVFSDMERILCKGDANLELCLKRCKLGRQTAFCNEMQGTDLVPTETKVRRRPSWTKLQGSTPVRVPV